MSNASQSEIKISAAARAKVMARAWELFRQTYRYPSIPFASIGRKCFAWALKTAWAEAREAARLAALGIAELKSRIAGLTTIADPYFHGSYAMQAERDARRATQRLAYERALVVAEAA